MREKYQIVLPEKAGFNDCVNYLFRFAAGINLISSGTVF